MTLFYLIYKCQHLLSQILLIYGKPSYRLHFIAKKLTKSLYMRMKIDFIKY